MSESIEILRYTEGTDAYGDPVPGEYKTHLTVDAKIAPNNPSEPVEVGRNAVITGGTAYIRHASVLDIKSDDRVKVRGVEYEIDGEVGVWERSSEFGHQFAYRKIAG